MSVPFPGKVWATTIPATPGDPAAVALARAEAASNPGDVKTLLSLAQTLPESDLAEALATIDQALQLAPENPAAHELRAVHLVKAGRFKEALEAANHLVRIAPQTAMAHAYLAQAEAGLGNRRAALAALHRAWELEPSLDYAAFQILELQIEANADAEVETTLEKLRTHFPGPRAMLVELRYRRTKRDKEAGLRVWEKMIVAPECDGGSLLAAVAILQQAGWADEGAQRIEAALGNPAIHKECGTAYTTLLAFVRHPEIETRVRAVPANTPVGVAARLAWLAVLGEKKRGKELAKLLRFESAGLRANPELWAATGAALLGCGEHRKAGNWLGGWKKRKDLTAAVLQPVAKAMRSDRRNAEARAASELALTLPRDASWNFHHAWLALDSALGKKLELWRKHRDATVREEVNAYEKALLVVSRCVADVLSAPQEERAAIFDRCRKKMRAEDYVVHYHAPDFSHSMLHAISLMAVESGTKYTRTQWLKSLPDVSHRTRERVDPVNIWEKNSTYVVLILGTIGWILWRSFGAKLLSHMLEK